MTAVLSRNDAHRALELEAPALLHVRREDIAFELGAVARMARAPPSFCSSVAAFVATLSMYTLAPSFFARVVFSAPRPIAATL